MQDKRAILNKAAIQAMLNRIPKETNVVIDGTNSKYIDPDVLETIFYYKHSVYSKGIIVTLVRI